MKKFLLFLLSVSLCLESLAGGVHSGPWVSETRSDRVTILWTSDVPGMAYVELSDGTVLDGTNAARILEYDMYYRFFGYGSDTGEGNEISDALFAETAKMVMEKAMGELSLSNARGFLSVLEESAADRTLMLWMKDESEQELVRAAGLACSLRPTPSIWIWRT